MIGYVFKPKRKRRGRVFSDENYRGRYKLPHMSKLVDVTLDTTDKRVAEKRLDEIIREAQQEAAGIIAPKALRDGAQTPMPVHLAEFVADLKARRRDSMYVYNIDKRLTLLLAACGWLLPKDVTPDSFTTWRAMQDKAPKTLNDYLASAVALLNWMERSRRIVANPLRHVAKVETRGRQVRKRRAFTADELANLLRVAGRRRVVYLLAATTGLRRAELAQLAWGDVHLDSPVSFLQVRASTTKNKRAATIHLTPEAAEALAAMRPESIKLTVPVFRRMMPTMVQFREDLAAAGIAYFDAEHRQADFHSLRKTYNTLLAKAGVGQAMRKAAMRVTDARLVDDVYLDAGHFSTAGLVDLLPRFDQASEGHQEHRATGTLGRIDGLEKRSQNRVADGPIVSQPVADRDTCGDTKTPGNPSVFRDLTQPVAVGRGEVKNWGSRIRT